MELWNKVCKTDPKHTKPVTIGKRTYTAIDPMYQVKRATEELGPAGKGWGWRVVDKTFLPTDYIAVTIQVWVGEKENYIDHIGMCGLYMDKAKSMPDGECFKKAVTDGVTKGLSYFGFSADVFLGKFDDSKYVEDVEKEMDPADAKLLDDLTAKLKSFSNRQEFEKWWKDPKNKRHTLSGKRHKELIATMQTKAKGFSNG